MTEAKSFVRPRGSMKIYLCGGTGINIATPLKKMLAEQPKSTTADVEIVLVDTSDSNLNPTNDGDNVYLFKGIDGGGKVRRDVHSVAAPKAREILERFQPGDFNVVVSSLGGGSGSVIAPHLLREIINLDKLCVAVGITNNDSKIEVNNTANTFATYEAISETIGRPVVLAPFHNKTPDKFDEVNLLVSHLLLQLTILASRQNAQLDTADLTNWLNYDRVTDVEPRLMGLYFTAGTAELPEGVHAVSVATLCTSGTNSRPNWVPDYQCVGYVPEGVTSEKNEAVHFSVADGVVQQIYSIIAADKAELDRRAGARSLSKRLSTSQAGNDGFVL